MNHWFQWICDQSTSGHSFFIFKTTYIYTNERTHAYIDCPLLICIYPKAISFFLSFTLASKENRRSIVVVERRRQARTCIYERYFWMKTCLFSYRSRLFVYALFIYINTLVRWLDKGEKKNDFVGRITVSRGSVYIVYCLFSFKRREKKGNTVFHFSIFI